MIVTSKRCYLNILTQLWPAERLLNANYYIGDQKPRSNYSINDHVSYNEFGQLVKSNSIQEVPDTFAGHFNISTSSCIDPEPYRIDTGMIMGGGQDICQPSEERYIDNCLNNPNTFMNVYKFLFRSQLNGNGIQILIFNNEANVRQFGHIICQYLSTNFGADIIFLDAKFRKNCQGQEFYQGNKELGAKTIREVRDYEMVYEFSMAVTNSECSGSVNNITMLLLTWDFPALMHLYQLLYPDDPIPPGNYTEDHIREILISRATANLKVRHMFSNITIQDWEGALDRMEHENMDFGQDGGLW